MRFANRYEAYMYAYPHKTAYRRIDPPVRLRDVWRDEDRSALFLYVHVPFCEMRCGYCNLFTQSRPGPGAVEIWLGALGRQAAVVRDELGWPAVRFARMAVGGGTPTILEPGQLDALFAVAASLGARPAVIPASVEVSPRTATGERLAVLRDWGVARVSVGVESMDAGELRALGRPQRAATVERALAAIRELGFPTLNLDLIYGAPGQTAASWAATLQFALSWAPEELYLYPLYRRPLTGMGAAEVDGRPARYVEARDLLMEAGYEQVSMRLFRRCGPAPVAAALAYDCQDDGMVGLGCGARSYTRGLHYSHEYAVAQDVVASLIDGYLASSDDDYAVARHGIHLDEDEQRRRFVIKSILRRPGLDLAGYEGRFGTSALDDFGLLARCVDGGLMAPVDGWLAPTDGGLAWSDAIGPALASEPVRALMAAYAPR